MMNQELTGQVEKLPGNKSGIMWTSNERPSLNHWYRVWGSDSVAYWKMVKDYHSPETKETYYKIVDYYQGDNMYCGKSLAQLRQIMRENTYRMVI